MTKKLEDYTEYDWSILLSEREFKVLRLKGTDPQHIPESNPGPLDYFKCAGCGNKLFLLSDKYNSHSGWPSFSDPASRESVAISIDNSHGMIREEVTCAKCNGHLGHRFDDGPKENKHRYCINYTALRRT